MFSQLWNSLFFWRIFAIGSQIILFLYATGVQKFHY